MASVANTRAVCDAVRSGAADLGLIEPPDVPADLAALAVGRDRLVLVPSPEYVTALGAGELSADRLIELPLLLREAGSGTRGAFLLELSRALRHKPQLPLAVALGSTATVQTQHGPEAASAV